MRHESEVDTRIAATYNAVCCGRRSSPATSKTRCADAAASARTSGPVAVKWSVHSTEAIGVISAKAQNGERLPSYSTSAVDLLTKLDAVYTAQDAALDEWNKAEDEYLPEELEPFLPRRSVDTFTLRCTAAPATWTRRSDGSLN